MKTNKYIIFIELLICIFLLSCGNESRDFNKKKDKTNIKNLNNKKQNESINNKNKIDLKKCDNYITSTNSFDLEAAKLKYISMMKKRQEEQMRLAAMSSDEIMRRVRIWAKEKNIDKLIEMRSYFMSMNQFDIALYIVSNLCDNAETEDEKNIANIYFADVMAEYFMENNDSINDNNITKYNKAKKLLVESLNKITDNIKTIKSKRDAFIVEMSLIHLLALQSYEHDADSIYKTFDSYVDKINKILTPKKLDEIRGIALLYSRYELVNKTPNIKIENLQRMLKCSNKILLGEIKTVVPISEIRKLKEKIQQCINNKL